MSPDRVPIIIGASNATGIKMEAYRKLKALMGHAIPSDPMLTGVNFYAELPRLAGDVCLTYSLHAASGQPDKHDPQVVHYYLGSPIAMTFTAQRAKMKKDQGYELQVSGKLRDKYRTSLLGIKRGKETIRPHLRVTDPAGKTIVDQALDYG